MKAEFQNLPTNFSAADEVVDFNSHLNILLDLHTPVITRTVIFTRAEPWSKYEDKGSWVGP